MSAEAFCYLVLCGICFLVALYVYIIFPETKNKTFMEISQMFESRNPSRFVDELKMSKYNGALESSSMEIS